MIINIGSRREVFWDEFIIDTTRTTAYELMHHPVRREAVMINDAPWEGNGWIHTCVLEDNGIFRMYYITMPMWNEELTAYGPPFRHSCYAESTDGIHWTKPRVGDFMFRGSYDNNIITDKSLTSFDVLIDPNPDCPPDEKYKAIIAKKAEKGSELYCMFSGDGVHFRDGYMISNKGWVNPFDSHNTLNWDPHRKKYVCYCRDVQVTDRVIVHDFFPFNEWMRNKRAVWRIESDDFRNWSDPEFIDYGDSPYGFEMYTNGIMPYPRADHIYIGLPMRYYERPEWTPTYDRLCGSEHRKWRMQRGKRFGLALTDALFMCSRDGKTFKRWDQAFMTPGPESPYAWIYGDCSLTHGILATDTIVKGEDKELSMYVTVNNWTDQPQQMYRYTLRMDGFISRRADFEKRLLVTKAFTFEGSKLSVNFSTSAIGYIRIIIEDIYGNPIDGYTGYELFGDSTDRYVDFPSPLEALNGKPIRMRIEMRDADIYSFKFDK